MSEPHLDGAVLSNLLSIMEDEYPLLVETFLSDSEERLRGIRAAFATADGAALRHAAHSFKGSCGNMGATVLSGLCKQLEEAARHNDLAAAQGLIAKVEREFSIVRTLLLPGRT
ncbi:Hpt domain-containing protein [Pseudomonas sp. MT3]|uniref:Hpt domain-containing protein n=1 Tax=Pseudomonas sp. ATCC 13867 TaxID=1294143 RepID=UPI0002C4E321|nr:Hpt domain-containing protein [Pseudomonas sp. ATCC 13867]AGI23660.1 histidine-containing phosphotransfer (HPt) domain protein [Pseudomonas sp. ATCC 13867]RFQ41597.1 Hpt domain-containing protein [Pseudomonas sp. ATCC 13867]